MYFKIDGDRITNSRNPIEGGFEQDGLEYECDTARLVIVSATEVRDMTTAEIIELYRPQIEGSMFSAAEGQIAASLSPYAYALTLQKASEGNQAALANVAWVEAIWADHDDRVANITTPYGIDMDFSSHGTKPNEVRVYA